MPDQRLSPMAAALRGLVRSRAGVALAELVGELAGLKLVEVRR